MAGANVKNVCDLHARLNSYVRFPRVVGPGEQQDLLFQGSMRKFAYKLSRTCLTGRLVFHRRDTASFAP